MADVIYMNRLKQTTTDRAMTELDEHLASCGSIVDGEIVDEGVWTFSGGVDQVTLTYIHLAMNFDDHLASRVTNPVSDKLEAFTMFVLATEKLTLNEAKYISAILTMASTAIRRPPEAKVAGDGSLVYLYRTVNDTVLLLSVKLGK